MSESLKITCLDNDCVVLYGKFWGEHGLSFLIETNRDSILFDAGTSYEVLSHNLVALQKDLSTVENVVLSHGHYDHTGALLWVLDHTDHPRLVAAPEVFTGKFSHRDGHYNAIGMPLTKELLSNRCQLVLTDALFTIVEGVTVTGAIPRRNDYELPDDSLLIEQGSGFATDPFNDDRSMVLDMPGGLVLLAGCCHSGIINTLDYVRDTFEKPVRAIAGGIHMKSASQARIDYTLERIKSDYPSINAFYLNHCTGDEAFRAFEAAFPSQVRSYPAGMEITF